MTTTRSSALLVALSLAALALFVWLRPSPLPSSPSDPVEAVEKSAAARPVVVPQADPATPQSLVEDSVPAMSKAELRATVRAKLQEWFATKTGDTETQERLTEELLTLLTDENTAEVIQELSAGEFNTPFATRALERWLTIDPSSAARWIGARPDAREEHALLVARRFLEDPAALRVYCDELPGGVWKESVLNFSSLEMASKDPVTAIAVAQSMVPGDSRTSALETITYAWFGRDLSAAAGWAKSVEDPVLRERLLAVGAKAIAVADPDLAVGWLVTAVKSEGLRNETALGVVETWADQHPAEAAKWVARFSDAGPRKPAINLVLNHWLKSDPASANAWLLSLPERDAVLARLKAEREPSADVP